MRPGPFAPDAFADDGDGRGITWGLSHIHPQKPNTNKGLYIVRFDCELSRDGAREEFKRSNLHWHEDSWFQPIARLPDDWRERILSDQSTVDRPTIGT